MHATFLPSVFCKMHATVTVTSMPTSGFIFYCSMFPVPFVQSPPSKDQPKPRLHLWLPTAVWLSMSTPTPWFLCTLAWVSHTPSTVPSRTAQTCPLRAPLGASSWGVTHTYEKSKSSSGPWKAVSGRVHQGCFLDSRQSLGLT